MCDSIELGNLYLPFMPEVDLQGPHKEQFTLPRPFEDPDGLLALSPKQRKHLGGWKRPAEFMKTPSGKPPCMINLISPYTITQDLVSDCSFVASLCITAAYERRFKKQLITRCVATPGASLATGLTSATAGSSTPKTAWDCPCTTPAASTW